MRTRIAVVLAFSLLASACGEQASHGGAATAPGTGGTGGTIGGTGATGGVAGTGGGGEGGAAGEGGSGGAELPEWIRDGSWTPTGGPSGFVGPFTLEVTEAGTWLLANDGVLFRSIDEGGTFDEVPGLGFGVSWEHDGTLLASDGVGLYRSDDDGLRFTYVCPLPFLGLTFDEGVFYGLAPAGNAVTLRRSDDLGETWHDVSTFGANRGFSSIRAVDGLLFVPGWAGSSRSLLRSTDGGETWSEVANAPPVDAIVSWNGTIFSRVPTVIAQSTDGGVTWSQTAIANLGTARGDARFYPSPAGLFSSYSDGIYRYDDVAQTWVAADAGSPSGADVQLAVDASGILLIHSFGVMRWDEGSSSWKPIPLGLAKTFIQGIDWIGGGVMASSYGLFASRDRGGSWARISSGYNLPVELVEGPGFLLGNNTFDLFRSVDDGVSWSSATDSLPATEYFEFVGRPLVREADVLLPTSNGLFRSTDGGVSWLSARDAMPHEEDQFGEPIYDQLGTVFDADGVILVTTRTDRRLLRSDDDGASWSEVDVRPTPDVEIMNWPFRNFVQIGDRVILGLVNRMVYSDDRGATWTTNWGWPSEDAALRELLAVDGVLLGHFENGAGSMGLWASTDEGATWISIGGGTPSAITSLTVAPDAIYAGTAHDGVWRLAIH